MSEHAAFCAGVVRDAFYGVHMEETDLAIQVEDRSPDIYGIHVTGDDPRAIWKAIYSDLMQSMQQDGLPLDLDWFLVVDMPCGEQFRYKTIEDVPLENVACTCGDPTHHVIHYAKGGK